MTAQPETVLVRLPEMVASFTEQYGVSADDFVWDGESGPHLFNFKIAKAVKELLEELTAEEQRQVAAGRPSDNCRSWFRIRDWLAEESAQVDLSVVTTVLYFYAHVLGVKVEDLD